MTNTTDLVKILKQTEADLQRLARQSARAREARELAVRTAEALRRLEANDAAKK
jgi:hypothetical protein